MDENVKKHIDIYKYIFFPWNLIVILPGWYGLVQGMFSILKEAEIFSIPSWVKPAVLILGWILIVLFLIIYPHLLPTGKKNKQNIFVIIYPEDINNDKYIKEDFVNDFKSYAACSIKNLNIIVTSFIKRRAFVNRVQKNKKKGKNYWESKSWMRLHQKLKGSVYISGILKKRKSNQKEHYIFNLSFTIGYYDFNKHLTPIMINELNLNFRSETLINIDFEFEEFKKFSSQFATFSEYIIGWSHLVSGNLPSAFKLHKDILKNNRSSFEKRGLLKDIKKVIYTEAISILRECRKLPLESVIDCRDFLLENYADDSSALIESARCIVITSSPDNVQENVLKAISIINKVRINKDNREVLYANRAYLYLLINNYDKAEEEYAKLFKKPLKIKVAESIIDYCDNQILSGTEFEKPTAHYVKVLFQSKMRVRAEILKKSFNKAWPAIQENEYYKEKLMNLQIEIKNDDSNKKRKRKRFEERSKSI